jgi:hypothetical protein
MELERIMINKCIEYFKAVNSESNDDSEIDKYGRPPKTLIIEYYDAVRRTEHHYKQTLRKRWEYSNTVLTELSIENELEENPANGMFLKIANARFYWDLDRKKAFIGMTFGPRFGRGYSFDIKMSDDSISLENEQIEWVS